jgi:hypothetical protein
MLSYNQSKPRLLQNVSPNIGATPDVVSVVQKDGYMQTII